MYRFIATVLFKYTNGALQSSIIKPKDYGLFAQEKKKDRLTVQDQKEIILALLNGEKTETLEGYYNQVLLNAGIRYHLFGAASSVQEGIAIAEKQLALGKGAEQLDKWRNSVQEK
ncbi:transferase [Terrilactibacillus sp. S3-3]|nr:transferase [Terrilactibacillus sp. S3-3]